MRKMRYQPEGRESGIEREPQAITMSGQKDGQLARRQQSTAVLDSPSLILDRYGRWVLAQLQACTYVRILSLQVGNAQ